jgi:hypothetical protein
LPEIYSGNRQLDITFTHHSNLSNRTQIYPPWIVGVR